MQKFDELTLRGKAEDVLRRMIVTETDAETEERKFRLNTAFEESDIAEMMYDCANIIGRWRADREEFHKTKETNLKIGADLLKAQMQLAKIQKEKNKLQMQVDDLTENVRNECEKQTRIDILNKRITQLESERDTYKYCYEFLAVQRRKES